MTLRCRVVGVARTHGDGGLAYAEVTTEGEREVGDVEALDGRVDGVIVEPCFAILDDLLARSPEGTCPG